MLIIDTIIADSADLIAAHRLDLDTVRDVIAQDIYGCGASVPARTASPTRQPAEATRDYSGGIQRLSSHKPGSLPQRRYRLRHNPLDYLGRSRNVVDKVHAFSGPGTRVAKSSGAVAR